MSFIFQDVDLTLIIDEEYDENATFNFNPPAACPPNEICLLVTQNSDSITFDGKLTVIPIEFRAYLADLSTFDFKCGTIVKAPNVTTTSRGGK